MREYYALIIFMVTLVLAAALAIIMQQTGEEIANTPTIITGEPEISQVAVDNIDSRKAQNIEFEIRGGNTPVRLNETIIAIRTQNSTQYMRPTS